MKILKGFALAMSLLTIIPFFKVHDFYKGINGYSVMFYPLIGFFIGLVLYSTWLLLHPHMPSFHLGILIFGLWILLTGALHLDGLSDTIDGFFVHKDRAFEVMKDPHTGGMGMIFTVTFLILKASSLAYLSYLDVMYLLPIILMLSRFNAVIAIYFYPYIGGGIASLAKQELKLSQVFIAFLYVFIICICFSNLFLILISLLTLFILKLFFIKRYNGFSGDIYGFCIEITELILLNIIIIGLL